MITSTNSAYSFSITRSVKNQNLIQPLNGLSIHKIINVSAKEFASLTGKKMNLWERISFTILKIKLKSELKLNPGLTIEKYTADKQRKRLGAGWWILIGAAGALLVLFIIFAIAYGGQK